MDSFINLESRTWNLQAIRDLVDPHDAKIIESISLSRIGWKIGMDGISRRMGNTRYNQSTKLKGFILTRKSHPNFMVPMLISSKLFAGK